MEIVNLTLRISERQNEMLMKLSKVSLKSRTMLIREAIELLFKPKEIK